MSLAAYHDLVAAKRVAFEPSGLAKVPELNSAMNPHQAHCTDFALRTGRAALFMDTGLGKTFSALEWGRVIVEVTNRPVLMLAPLAVGPQHQREAERWGIDAKYIRHPSEMTGPRIYIVNYERLQLFDASLFAGVILDESSILKSFTGVIKRQLVKAFAETPYRLACTATPAPNDHTELGQHADFLGVMESPEMLSRFFIADQTDMGHYRLKAAAARHFWDWMSSWSRCIAKPSDLGFSDDGFTLPPLLLERHRVRADLTIDAGQDRSGQQRLLRTPDTSATSVHKEKRLTAGVRADEIAAAVAAQPGETWALWCDTDYEADALQARIPDAIEVRGSMHPDMKEERLVAFAMGEIGRLITKAKMGGYGSNWQHCARTGLIGVSYSYENFYQMLRRFWRYGQTREVQAHIACADTEEPQWTAVQRKAGDHETMKLEMAAAMKRASRVCRVLEDYEPDIEAVFPPFLGAA